MEKQYFISKSKELDLIFKLFNSFDINYKEFNDIKKVPLSNCSLIIIDFNKLSKSEIKFTESLTNKDKIYFYTNENNTDNIIHLIKLGYKNIYFDISKLYSDIKDILKLNKLTFDNKILSEIINNATESIVITDVDGSIIYVNKKFTDITGYTYEEAIGQNPRILKTDYHDDIFYTKLWETISSGNVCECEFKNKRKDGTFYWEFARISPIFDNNGIIKYYFALKKDITVEKEVKGNYENHKELINSIHNYSVDYFCIKDNEDKWIFANKKLCNLLGIPQNKFFNKTDKQISKLVSFNKSVFEKCIYYNNLAWEKNEEVSFFQQVNDGNNELYIKFVKKPIFNLDGSKKAIITSGKDVTDIIGLQKQVEDEKNRAENANKLKSLFISNVSHDLRSPLNAIYGFINIMNNDKSLNEKNQHYIKIIKNSTERILKMLNDILDLTKLENNQIAIKNSKFLVYLMLMEIVEQNILAAEEKNLELILDYRTNKNLEIFTDELRLNQIINNLVTNAIKYTDEGYVKIICDVVDDKLSICVKDSGIGIPKDKQKFIFERFYQIEDKSIRRYKGSGLGLSICKLLSEKISGELTFKSTKNVGSEFCFTLPLELDKNKKTQTKKITSNKKNTVNDDIVKNKNILIVEDDENSISLYKIYLNKANLLFANDGIEAIEKVKSNKNLDVVLMDIQLPKLNGIDAIKEIRKFNNNVVIISQTANAMLTDREECIKAGSNDYITKPINNNELFNTIAKHF